MPPAGRRIGFLDYHLDNFHANTFLDLLRGPLAPRGFDVAACTALRPESRAWADQHQVQYCAHGQELARHADVFMVLAPSNPEVHAQLFEQVAPFGRPTYVDKPFAPDLATARRIFDLADRAGTPLQTSSALRYTNVQRHVAALPEPVRHMVTWGGGRSFEEYAIHPVELAVSCLGHEAQSLCRRGNGPESQLLINFSGGRTATVNVFCDTRTPYAASVTTAQATDYLAVDTQDLFADALAGILDFLATGAPGVDRRETMTIMNILDTARDPAALSGFVSLR